MEDYCTCTALDCRLPKAPKKSDWIVTLGYFSMHWKEPMTEDDVHDIEQLTDIAVRAMRRRLEVVEILKPIK